MVSTNWAFVCIRVRPVSFVSPLRARMLAGPPLSAANARATGPSRSLHALQALLPAGKQVDFMIDPRECFPLEFWPERR
jgi:hypothetical protein